LSIIRYGIDGPGPLAAGAGAGVACIVVGALAWSPMMWVGIGLLAYAGGHFFASAVGKGRTARRMIDAIDWRGDEDVLDVGCGHGLLLIETARRLTTGRAVGVDVWRQKDQWRNSRDATLENVKAAGVEARVEVRDGDARQLPFPDASFDVVVSCLVIHNIRSGDERAQAIREIARVLRPGGQVAIIDMAATARYAAELRAAGLVDLRRTFHLALVMPTARQLTARKPSVLSV
jgi:ubiquinone/menaquinone biosynthesis C-methylase UbiE